MPLTDDADETTTTAPSGREIPPRFRTLADLFSAQEEAIQLHTLRHNLDDLGSVLARTCAEPLAVGDDASAFREVLTQFNILVGERRMAAVIRLQRLELAIRQTIHDIEERTRAAQAAAQARAGA